ncbi:MAG TPA: hypothetical protein VEO95_07550 [Chthoniobacteraceae bacterium]|nr:hypothetical protein [Chthoniobacteraceae bacterium]
MSNKKIVEDLLQWLPDDVSLYEIARRIEFVAGVRKGAELATAGESRLARECAKLRATDEQALADEGLSADAAEWPEY